MSIVLNIIKISKLAPTFTRFTSRAESLTQVPILPILLTTAMAVKCKLFQISPYDWSCNTSATGHESFTTIEPVSAATCRCASYLPSADKVTCAVCSQWRGRGPGAHYIALTLTQQLAVNIALGLKTERARAKTEDIV